LALRPVTVGSHIHELYNTVVSLEGHHARKDTVIQLDRRNESAIGREHVRVIHICDHSLLKHDHHLPPCKRHSPPQVFGVSYYTIYAPNSGLNKFVAAFTKGLACIARYGDELCLHATSEQLTLCATNSAKSAYCGIKFLPEFFDTYRVGAPADAWGMTPEGGEELPVRGQLLVKVARQIYPSATKLLI
jgi:hypothetical protein